MGRRLAAGEQVVHLVEEEQLLVRVRARPVPQEALNRDLKGKKRNIIDNNRGKRVIMRMDGTW